MPTGNVTLPSDLLDGCNEGIMWCISNYAYQVTSGLWWILMLLGFSIAIAMASARMGSTRAYAHGSFVGMIGAVWFAIMGLMAWWVASAFIINGIISFAVLIMSRSR